SVTAFFRLICFHLLCPAKKSSTGWRWVNADIPAKASYVGGWRQRERSGSAKIFLAGIPCLRRETQPPRSRSRPQGGNPGEPGDGLPTADLARAAIHLRSPLRLSLLIEGDAERVERLATLRLQSQRGLERLDGAVRVTDLIQG